MGSWRSGILMPQKNNRLTKVKPSSAHQQSASMWQAWHGFHAASVLLPHFNWGFYIDVSDAHRLHIRCIRPEEVQRQNTPEIDQIRRWADVVWAELICVTKSELEQVNSHECQQHQTGDSQVQDVDALWVRQCKLHIPGPLQSTKTCKSTERRMYSSTMLAGRPKPVQYSRT